MSLGTWKLVRLFCYIKYYIILPSNIPCFVIMQIFFHYFNHVLIQYDVTQKTHWMQTTKKKSSSFAFIFLFLIFYMHKLSWFCYSFIHWSSFFLLLLWRENTENKEKTLDMRKRKNFLCIFLLYFLFISIMKKKMEMEIWCFLMTMLIHNKNKRLYSCKFTGCTR